MEIDYFLSIINNNLNSEKNICNYLEKGDIIKGSIIDVKGDSVILEILGYGIVETKTDINISNLRDKSLNFVISNIEDNVIELKPILNKNNNISIQNQEIKTDIYGDIIEKYDLIDNNTSREIIKNLYKFNLPITQENIDKGLKVYNKFEQVYYKNENEKVIFVDEKNKYENSINYNRNTPDYKKIDISKFLIVNIDEYPSNEDLSFIFDSLLLKFPISKVNKELLKIITYFIKKDIDLTINNIENFYEFISDPKQFISSLLDKIRSLTNKNLINIKRFKIDFNNNSIEDFEKYSTELKKEFIKLESVMNKNNFGNKENVDYFREISRKLDFLNNMNRQIALFYIPIEIYNKERTGFISIFSKNNENERSNIFKNLNVFIELHMVNLGDVEIYCEFNNRNISINFNIEQKNLSKFQEKEYLLRELLDKKGFNVEKINYKYEDKLNLLDTLAINDKKLYYLDVQV